MKNLACSLARSRVGQPGAPQRLINKVWLTLSRFLEIISLLISDENESLAPSTLRATGASWVLLPRINGLRPLGVEELNLTRERALFCFSFGLLHVLYTSGSVHVCLVVAGHHCSGGCCISGRGKDLRQFFCYLEVFRLCFEFRLRFRPSRTWLHWPMFRFSQIYSG